MICLSLLCEAVSLCVLHPPHCGLLSALFLSSACFHPSSCPPFGGTSFFSFLRFGCFSLPSPPRGVALPPFFSGIFLQELARPQRFQVMEAMAPDETDQGRRRKVVGEGEDLEDALQDQIRATEQEIRATEHEIRAKKEEIRGLRAEIRAQSGDK
ncbi:uncharacterized protein [Physcomitrium patens]|uniref:uncharacterized protein n=1 Tax=Physcomitrium patens TaxID=3218 RepID=UPI003CCCD370